MTTTAAILVIWLKLSSGHVIETTSVMNTEELCHTVAKSLKEKYEDDIQVECKL